MDDLTVYEIPPLKTLSIGNKTDTFYFKNADFFNSIIFFAIQFYNNFSVGYGVDKEFWSAFLDFFNFSFGTNKKVKFEDNGIKISEDKKEGTRILYSKGKDSHYLKKSISAKTIQLYSGISCEKWADEIIMTNIDDLIWAKSSGIPKRYKLEMFLPIISPYIEHFIGVEKELWDNSTHVFGFSLKKYYELLNDYDLIVSSPILNKYSIDIVRELYKKGEHSKYYKCNKTNSKDTEYCYLCTKCMILYFSGADEDIGFNRKKIEKFFGTKRPMDVLKKLKERNLAQVNKFEVIYKQLYENFL